VKATIAQRNQLGHTGIAGWCARHEGFDLDQRALAIVDLGPRRPGLQGRGSDRLRRSLAVETAQLLPQALRVLAPAGEWVDLRRAGVGVHRTPLHGCQQCQGDCHERSHDAAAP
jgi:hypothetical protein